MKRKRLLVVVFVALAVTIIVSLYVLYFVGRNSTGSTYPRYDPYARDEGLDFSIQSKGNECDVLLVPTLSEEDVIAIAEKKGLPKYKSGFWTVGYYHSYSWSRPPFSDECIWAVRSHEWFDGGDFDLIGHEVIFVRDANKEASF